MAYGSLCIAQLNKLLREKGAKSKGNNQQLRSTCDPVRNCSFFKTETDAWKERNFKQIYNILKINKIKD